MVGGTRVPRVLREAAYGEVLVLENEKFGDWWERVGVVWRGGRLRWLAAEDSISKEDSAIEGNGG